MQIVDIAAGAWHSAAVSAFGDLYMWGWNLNGQMARALHEQKRVEFADGTVDLIKHKLPSVFTIPEVITIDGQINSSADDNENEKQYKIIAVYCGTRHTIVRTECDQYFACGWNKYGQLGVRTAATDTDEAHPDVVQFCKIHFNFGHISNVICGNWATVVLFSQ